MAKQLDAVTVSDENGVTFDAIKTEHGVFALVDQEPNGFGQPKGVQFLGDLKELRPGVYGA